MSKKNVKSSKLSFLAIPFTPLGLVVFFGIYIYFGLPRWTLLAFIIIQVTYFIVTKMKNKNCYENEE